ncbi:hypothetical protein OK016_14230 [Vibrio chagasii]|nr:hypothetical protein [Vibrio chagasii]
MGSINSSGCDGRAATTAQAAAQSTINAAANYAVATDKAAMLHANNTHIAQQAAAQQANVAAQQPQAALLIPR